MIPVFGYDRHSSKIAYKISRSVCRALPQKRSGSFMVCPYQTLAVPIESMPKKEKTGQADHGTEDLDAILEELKASDGGRPSCAPKRSDI